MTYFIKLIHQHFGVGHVYTYKNTATFYVTAIKDLTVIVEHFKIYPLVTAKSIDFVLFLNVYNLILAKAHLTLEGIKEIVAIKANQNLGLSNDLIAAFPNIIKLDRPVYNFNGLPTNPNWLSGFVTGDGSFSITITITKGSTAIGERVQLVFSIELHIRDLDVLKGISNFFLNTTEAKYVYIRNTRENMAYFTIKNFSIINETIIPFFSNNLLIECKKEDFDLYKQVASMIVNKEHLTRPGLDKIIEIRELMNNYK